MKLSKRNKPISLPLRTLSLKILCLTWLASLILTGSSPLFYLNGQSNDSHANHHPSLWVTTSAQDALDARVKFLAQENSDGGMGSSPISGSVNLWLWAGQSILTGGTAGAPRFTLPVAIQTSRFSSSGLGSLSRELSLAGAAKRLEFTLLALNPTGVS